MSNDRHASPSETGLAATVESSPDAGTQPTIGLPRTIRGTGVSAPSARSEAGTEPGGANRAGAGELADDAADYAQLATVDREHYTQRAALSRGGMGQIVTARDRRLHRQVAIKELRADSPELRARFEREALLTARLQHPNIVSIHEAGRWPSGEPFYAMKLVRGRSLDKVIEEATTPTARLALLPHVIAVADALGYAHAERVIHRDLKPHNVMIGEFGETVVIDWGLAKDLDAAASAGEEAATPYRTRGAPGPAVETIAGEVMGTPAYMPPEQAEGASVDERADVYAIGAMLFHVLSGAPPYTGKTTYEVLAAVIEGRQRPLDEALAGYAPDLIAIVRRAMERDPAARYRDGRELAEDLRRFQTGQLVGAHRYSRRQRFARWLRRYRAAASVAAVAALVLVVVSIASVRRILAERQHAEDERALAERHRADVEDLLGFMVGDLRDKLKPIGKLELLDSVARKAQAYYATRPPTRPEDEHQRGVVLRNIGDVLQARGDTRGALASYRAAVAIATWLVAIDPTNVDWQRALAAADQRVGDILIVQGDVTGALAIYQAARALGERTANDVQGRYELAAIELKVGDAQRALGKTTEAIARYQAALAIASQLATIAPARGDVVRAVLASNLKLGDLMLPQGDATGALAAFRAARAAGEKLVALDATNPSWQRDLSIADEKIGDVLWDQENDRDALAAYRSALALREPLAARDPANAQWQRDLMIGKEKVGDALKAMQDYPGALAAIRDALAIAQRLAAADPANAEWARNAGVVQERLGDTLRAAGDKVAALAAFRAARDVTERLAAQDPDNAEWQRDRVVSAVKVGEALDGVGDRAAAAAEYAAALALAEQLAAKHPTDASHNDVLVCRLRLATVLVASRDLAGALAVYRGAADLARTLATAHATNTIAQRTLTSTLLGLGDVQLQQRAFEAAVATYRDALAVADKLVATDPSNAEWQHDVATCHAKIGDALQPRDRRGAKAAYAAALAIVERFMGNDPMWAADRQELRGKLGR